MERYNGTAYSVIGIAAAARTRNAKVRHAGWRLGTCCRHVCGCSDGAVGRELWIVSDRSACERERHARLHVSKTGRGVGWSAARETLHGHDNMAWCTCTCTCTRCTCLCGTCGAGAEAQPTGTERSPFAVMTDVCAMCVCVCVRSARAGPGQLRLGRDTVFSLVLKP